MRICRRAAAHAISSKGRAMQATLPRRDGRRQARLRPWSGETDSLPDPSILPDQARPVALNVYAVRAENPRLIGRVGRFQRDRIASLAQALERGFLAVDSATTISPLSASGSAGSARHRHRECRVDHRVAAHFQREMLSPGEHFRRDAECCGSGSGSPKRARLPRSGPSLVRKPANSCALPSRPCARNVPALDHIEAAGSGLRCAAASFFGGPLVWPRPTSISSARARCGKRRMKPRSPERRNQAVNARFRAQRKRLFHLVERGRHAIFLTRLWMKKELFSVFRSTSGHPREKCTNRERSYTCSRCVPQAGARLFRSRAGGPRPCRPVGRPERMRLTHDQAVGAGERSISALS